MLVSELVTKEYKEYGLTILQCLCLSLTKLVSTQVDIYLCVQLYVSFSLKLTFGFLRILYRVSQMFEIAFIRFLPFNFGKPFFKSKDFFCGYENYVRLLEFGV